MAHVSLVLVLFNIQAQLVPGDIVSVVKGATKDLQKTGKVLEVLKALDGGPAALVVGI